MYGCICYTINIQLRSKYKYDPSLFPMLAKRGHKIFKSGNETTVVFDPILKPIVCIFFSQFYTLFNENTAPHGSIEAI